MAGLNINRGRRLSTISQLPNLASTLYGWEVPLTLEKVYQNVSEGDFTYTTKKINFKGVWQPFSMEQLALLPEGQRSWSHYWVHVKANTVNLDTADKIIFQDKRYKIIEQKNYTLNGYIEYHVIEDYEDVEEEINNNE